MLAAACAIARRTAGSTRAAPSRISFARDLERTATPSKRLAKPRERAIAAASAPASTIRRTRRSKARSSPPAGASSRSIARVLLASTIFIS